MDLATNHRFYISAKKRIMDFENVIASAGVKMVL